jgi:hypothetical protein
MTDDTGAGDDDATEGRGESTAPSGDGPSDAPGDDGHRRDADEETVDPEQVSALREEIDELEGEIASLESRVDDRTVDRSDFEAELKRYVRARQRRGHATGWGPSLVLLYGTAMTLGAFFYLGEIWAILAMVVVWLSTLGLFVVMLFVGGFVGAVRKVAGLRDLVGKVR